MPNRLPSKRLFSISARSAVFSRNTPESIVCRSWPDPRMVTPRIVTSGAVTVTTLPAPPPSSTAPGRPVSTTRRSILIAPLYSPGASSMTSPSCARSSTACSGCSGAAFSVSALAKPGAPAAKIAAGMMREKQSTCRSRLKPTLGLDEHAALHLHVHGVAEPRAIVPVDAGLIRRERHRGRRHRRDFHVDAVVHDRRSRASDPRPRRYW